MARCSGSPAARCKQGCEALHLTPICTLDPLLLQRFALPLEPGWMKIKSRIFLS